MGKRDKMEMNQGLPSNLEYIDILFNSQLTNYKYNGMYFIEDPKEREVVFRFNYPNKSLPDIIKDVRLAIPHFCSKKDSKQFSYAIIDLALQICDNDNLSLKYLFSKIKERYDQ